MKSWVSIRRKRRVWFIKEGWKCLCVVNVALVRLAWSLAPRYRFFFSLVAILSMLARFYATSETLSWSNTATMKVSSCYQITNFMRQTQNANEVQWCHREISCSSRPRLLGARRNLHFNGHWKRRNVRRNSLDSTLIIFSNNPYRQMW